MTDFIGAAVALLLGGVLSYINYKLTGLLMQKKAEFISFSAVIRQLVNVAYLVAVYFIAPHTPCSVVFLLVGAVLGLTGTMFFFTYKLVKKTDKNSDGGEGNG